MQYHWLLTVQYQGGTFVSGGGVVDLQEGETRAQVFKRLLTEVNNSNPRVGGGGHHPHVVFFSLEPNQL